MTLNKALKQLLTLISVIVLLTAPAAVLSQDIQLVPPDVDPQDVMQVVEEPSIEVPVEGDEGIGSPDGSFPVQGAPEYIEEDASILLAPDQDLSILRQDHAYNITLRGNGEVVVYGKFIFTNTTPEPLSEYQLRIEDAVPSDIAGVQVIRERRCIRYLPSPPIILDNDQFSWNEMRKQDQIERCAEYEEPNYYYGWGTSKYLPLTATLNGDSIDVALPQPVMPNESTAILLTYRTDDYTTRTITGAYNYSFQSLKVNDKIQNLSIGIDTDSDLYLKNAEGDVNYRSVGMESMALDGAMGGAKALESGQLDNLYSQIGYGRITKSTSGLQPLESYTVTGAFGTSAVQVFGTQILVGILLFIGVVALIIGIIYIVARRYSKHTSKDVEQKKPHSKVAAHLMVIGLTSFGSSLLILFYTFFVFFLSSLFSSSYYYHSTVPLLVLFLMIVSIGVYLMLFLIPALVVGWKRTVWAGVATAFATIIWLFIYLVILLVIFLAFFYKPDPYAFPMMRGIGGGVMMDGSMEKVVQ